MPAIARYPVAAAADCLVPLLRALTPTLRERGLARLYELEDAGRGPGRGAGQDGTRQKRSRR